MQTCAPHDAPLKCPAFPLHLHACGAISISITIVRCRKLTGDGGGDDGAVSDACQRAARAAQRAAFGLLAGPFRLAPQPRLVVGANLDLLCHLGGLFGYVAHTRHKPICAT